MKGGENARRRAGKLRIALWVAAVLAVGSVVWCCWVYGQIETYAHRDQVAHADAIAVLGAAEWDGRPSPVFRARLDHALHLYRRGIAPLIITVGGSGGDQYNEGDVGRQYLIKMGVPERDIVAVAHSHNTEESVRRIAVIARARNLRLLEMVSDPTHMFRLHAICVADGLHVLTSPRTVPASINRSLEMKRITHELLSYTLWKMHLH